MLLLQAGATRIQPPAAHVPVGCAQVFRVGLVADVAGLDSSADAAVWRGVHDGLRGLRCAQAEVAVPTRPSDYRRMLQAYAGDDLVIAASFLLTDAVADVARANPGTRFMLVDPMVAPMPPPNVAVLVFREDQAAFLAGALATMVTRTGLIAGVYGPSGVADQRNRSGFEHGAAFVRPGIRVLGAYQPAGDGLPYANPGWGAARARAFVRQGADLIFGTGGSTGTGALRGAAQAGGVCIGAGDSSRDPAVSDCLLASTIKHVDRGVALMVADAAAGRWAGGIRTVGLAEGAVELGPVQHELPSDQLEHLQIIAAGLASGTLKTGA
ncbi:MAG TPA: BMP family ABC transporter substrate-binding protein [Candidatus Dormibacteraeota bacterium]